MGFLTDMFTSAVKVALTPVAIASDAFKVAAGVEPDTTKDLLKSAAKDVASGMDALMGESDEGLI